MADKAAALYQKIQAEFEKNIAANRRIQDFQRKENHTAKEVSLYSAELGKCASKAFSVVLGDKKLDQETARNTIVPMLQKTHDMVMDAAEDMQKQEDNKIGIHLKVIRPEFPKKRVDGLIGKLIEYQEDDNGQNKKF